MNELQYDFDQDDLAAFLNHRLRSDPPFRLAITGAHLGLVGGLMGGLSLALRSHRTPLILTYAILAVSAAIIFRPLWRRLLVQLDIRRYRPSGTHVPGPLHLSVDQNAVTLTTPNSTAAYDKTAIERVVSNDSYVVLYIGPVTPALMPRHAVIIPRNKIRAGDCDRFLAALASGAEGRGLTGA
jgi:hypothetical protein